MMGVSCLSKQQRRLVEEAQCRVVVEVLLEVEEPLHWAWAEQELLGVDLIHFEMKVLDLNRMRQS